MSVLIQERLGKDGAAVWQEMRADTIDEALEAMLPRIRTRSRSFYKEEIRKDLERDGTTVVDKHAGGGFLWVITLVSNQKEKGK